MKLGRSCMYDAPCVINFPVFTVNVASLGCRFTYNNDISVVNNVCDLFLLNFIYFTVAASANRVRLRLFYFLPWMTYETSEE